MAGPRVRFAPSPTGRLHVGNIRVALANFLFARAGKGAFVLRLDDTDRERSTEAFARGIEADLRWLGVEWDELARQSDRFARYDAAADRLRGDGRLYACYETPQELELKRKARLNQGRPPVYDRAALRLTDADRARFEAEGRRPHWRFKLEARHVEFVDLVRGAQQVDEASQSDPVLVRADGTYLYTLPSVVDDIDMDISHVIRGEDHVTNTGTQIQIFEALGARPPRFAHLPLLVDAEGGGLSKRLGSLSVADLREQGIEALALAALLARLGTSDAVEPVDGMDELVESFDLTHIARASPRFSLEELSGLNARTLHRMDYAAVADRLQAHAPGAGEAFWLAVRANLQTLADAGEWWGVVNGPVEPVIEDAAFCAAAADLLPPDPLSEASWRSWTSSVSAATGRKGRALFHPLRLALTARERGPEMQNLLPLIGRARAEARLLGRTA
ncbi:MAG: glutamate--tRNA ligase [Reyranellaceae bacterium]